MRKSLLFILMAMILPMLAAAQTNQAISKNSRTSAQTKTDSRLYVDPSVLKPVAQGNADMSYTISTWVNIDKYMTQSNAANNMVVFGYGGRAHCNDNGCWNLCIASDGYVNITGWGGKGAAGKITTKVVPTNQWVYLTAVYDCDAPSLSIYMDGELLATKAMTAQHEWFTNETPAIYFASYGFSKYMDEVQIYNKALTADELAIAKVNAQAVNGLVALYTLDEIAEGTTGQFANQSTQTCATSLKLTYENCTGTQAWDNGIAYVIPEGSAVEAAPTMAEGREIAATEASVYIMDGEGGTLSATDGTTTYTAADEPYTISTGTTLTLTATPDNGYELVGIYASDLSGENVTEITDGTYTVIKDIALTARFTNERHTLTVDNALNIPYTITYAGEEVTDLTQILGGGAQYTLSLSVPNTMVLESVMLGEDALTANSDGTYTFMLDADATLTINARNKEQYTVTFEQPANGTIAVTTGSSDVPSGSTVLEGSEINIAVTPNTGYIVNEIYVNSTAINGTTYTVNSNVVITVDLVEGSPYCEPTGHSNHERYVGTLTVSDDLGNTADIVFNGDVNTSYTFVNDQFVTEPGATVTLTVQSGKGDGTWQHSYFYIDYGRDGTFDVDPTLGRANGDLVSFNYYKPTGNPGGNDGYNSKGESGQRYDQSVVGTLPTFTIPADLAPGKYRARYRLYWNNVDPCAELTSQGTETGRACYDFTFVIPAQVYDTPRNITIASENAEYGTVAFTSPASDEATISTDQKKVAVLATPAEGYVFLNWTNSANEVVSTEAAYTYSGEADETLTAHFGHSVTFSFNNEGTMTVTAGDSEVATGDLLPVGTALTFTLAPASAKIITLFTVNGVNCLDQLVNNVYTTTLDANLTVAAEFGDYTATITWEVVGNGTVEAGYEWNDNLDGCNDAFNSGDVIASGAFNDNSGLTFWLRPGKQESSDLYETVQSATYTPTDGEVYDIINEEGLGEDGGPEGDAVAADGTPVYYYTLSVLPTADLHFVFAFTQNGQAAIDEIFGDDAEDVPAVYYNLNGVRVDGSNLTPGIYVVKKGSKTAKVIVM